MDNRDGNLEAAENLVGRTIESIELSNRNEGLSLELDDGSRIQVDALLTGKLEIVYLSPQRVFEIDRTIMEEAYVDLVYKRLREEGQIPQLHDDRLPWTELPPISGSEPGAPTITHAAQVELEGGILPIYRTDDGRRHVDASDIKRVFAVDNASEVSDEVIGRAITTALSELERQADPGE